MAVIFALLRFLVPLLVGAVILYLFVPRILRLFKPGARRSDSMIEVEAEVISSQQHKPPSSKEE